MTEKKTNKQQKANVPNLRFPGFEEDWEDNILGEVCKMQAGKFVSASEIRVKAQDDLFPCYGGNGLRGYTNSYNQVGLHSLIGRQGALCGNVTLADGTFYATEHAVVVTPNDGIDTLWMYYLLTHLNLNQYATGAAQPGLSVQNLERVEIVIPRSKLEQQKISSFLNLIDQRIQTQNKIIEKLETLIKGLRESLFNKNIRFPISMEEWQLCQVSNLLRFVPTNSLSWEMLKYDFGNIYNLHYGLIHSGLPSHIDLSKHTLPTVLSNAIPNKYAICENGDIAFADASEDREDVAKCVEFVDCDNKQVICGLHTIHGKNKGDQTVIGFKAHLFSTRAFRYQVKKIAQGTKVYSVSVKALGECQVFIPNKTEQMKITKVLTALSDKLIIEKQVLERFSMQKLQLLKSLFI